MYRFDGRELPKLTRLQLFLSVVLPEFLGSHVQWFRRARGGRWSRRTVRSGCSSFAWVWMRVSSCPGEGSPPIHSSLLPRDVCANIHDTLMVDEEAGHFEPARLRCCCEEWP